MLYGMPAWKGRATIIVGSNSDFFSWYPQNVASSQPGRLQERLSKNSSFGGLQEKNEP
jgi:hypothetical protein